MESKSDSLYDVNEDMECPECPECGNYCPLDLICEYCCKMDSISNDSRYTLDD